MGTCVSKSSPIQNKNNSPKPPSATLTTKPKSLPLKKPPHVITDQNNSSNNTNSSGPNLLNAGVTPANVTRTFTDKLGPMLLHAGLTPKFRSSSIDKNTKWEDEGEHQHQKTIVEVLNEEKTMTEAPTTVDTGGH